MEKGKTSKARAWIMAFRLRTLPLSFSVVIMGTAVSIGDGGPRMVTLGLTLLTTLFLQILSNISNDYGDSVKGTDGADRVGPERAVQSGVISLSEMRRAIMVFAGLSLAAGLVLLWAAYASVGAGPVLTLLAVGVLCIAAAITYTVGRHPYGYAGLGDLSVFVFFGLVGVVGTYFIQTGVIGAKVVLPAVSVGLLSCGVLNMNNMRDLENDRRAGKRTLPVIMGLRLAAAYQIGLMVCAVAGMACQIALFGVWEQCICLVGAVPLLVNAARVWGRREDVAYLDGQLKVISLSTFAMSVIFCAASAVWL